MPIQLAVPKETTPGEHRVALVPEVVERLSKLGAEVILQEGAGVLSNFPDAAYGSARIVADAMALYAQADVVLKVQPPEAAELELLREGAIIAGFMQPHRQPERVARLRDKKITAFAMELVPRISRAQSMDALSSQASVAGYKAVLVGASLTGRFFPMLTTAAGTIRPAKVLIIGVGVAGLQAIATARRLGAIVEAYDVRSATKEQVESLGARFVGLAIGAEGSGGYARELTEAEKAQQQQLLATHVAAADVVISTAAIPGRQAPLIITEPMVETMHPGAVIVDLAAESGGNCALTQPGEQRDCGGVIVYGPLNVPSMMAEHASVMYAKNLLNFLSPMLKDGELTLDWEDEVIAGSALTADGEIKHAATRSLVEGATS